MRERCPKDACVLQCDPKYMSLYHMNAREYAFMIFVNVAIREAADVQEKCNKNEYNLIQKFSNCVHLVAMAIIIRIFRGRSKKVRVEG